MVRKVRFIAAELRLIPYGQNDHLLGIRRITLEYRVSSPGRGCLKGEDEADMEVVRRNGLIVQAAAICCESNTPRRAYPPFTPSTVQRVQRDKNKHTVVLRPSLLSSLTHTMLQ